MKKIFIVSIVLALILILFFQLNLLRKKVITIAYTSDLQGLITPHPDDEAKIEPRPLLGGSAYFASYLKRERESAKQSKRGLFLVDTGNFFSGQAEGYFFKGVSVIEIMNKLGYDALVVGAKDFAFGEENLRNLAKIATFPFLGANIVREGTGEIADFVRPYIIVEHQGIKAGFIGVTTPLILSENIKGLKIIDPALAVKRYVAALKNAGVDLIVVLSNLGLKEDKKLAQQVSGINIIIGGNDFGGARDLCPLYYIVEPKNKTIIPETSFGGITWREIKLIFDKRKNLVNYKVRRNDLWTAKIKPDSKIQSMIQKYAEKVREKKKEIVGNSESLMIKPKEKESNLGNWAADILRAKTKADIALVGGLQTDLKPGPIRIGDLYNVLPIADGLANIIGFNLSVLELTGEQIIEILEMGVAYGFKKDGELLQVSGLKYSYDLKRKNWDRVIEVEVAGKKLDFSKTYKVALNGYLAAGLSSYTTIKNVKKRTDTGLMDFDVLAEYVMAYSPIAVPLLEERIQRVEEK